MTTTTLSPRTLGMYAENPVFYCGEMQHIYAYRFAGSVLIYKKDHLQRPPARAFPVKISDVKLVLKRPPFQYENGIGYMKHLDELRQQSHDLGGFIIQNGTETWVASLIDAGVAVEMEVGNG